MSAALTAREIAEGLEELGEDLIELLGKLDRICGAMGPDTVARVNAIPHQEWLDGVARGLRDVGRSLSAECDQAEEADDRRRDNPFERDFRRLGQ